MHADDPDPTRAEALLTDRYDAVSDCDGHTLVYDVDNPDAWVRSDLAVETAEYR